MDRSRGLPAFGVKHDLSDMHFTRFPVDPGFRGIACSMPKESSALAESALSASEPDWKKKEWVLMYAAEYR